jgi:hypothetical protein
MPTGKNSQHIPADRTGSAARRTDRLEDIGGEATKYLNPSKAENTRRAYSPNKGLSLWGVASILPDLFGIPGVAYLSQLRCPA